MMITIANSYTHLNFFFNIKSLSAVTVKNPTNKPPQSLITQPLLQFKFNNDFQTSLYVKIYYSLTDWELLTSHTSNGSTVVEHKTGAGVIAPNFTFDILSIAKSLYIYKFLPVTEQAKGSVIFSDFFSNQYMLV